MEQFEIYFANWLRVMPGVRSISIEAGCNSFGSIIFKKDWQWLTIVKLPRIHILPDILTPADHPCFQSTVCGKRFDDIPQADSTKPYFDPGIDYEELMVDRNSPRWRC
jgi:hypothetical protein